MFVCGSMFWLCQIKLNWLKCRYASILCSFNSSTYWKANFYFLFLVGLNLLSSALFSSPQVLKGSKKLCLSVRSVGRIPGGYVTNHVYTWVDPQGRSVSPPPDLPEHRSATLRRTDSQRRSNMQLLQEGDEKKVETLHAKHSTRGPKMPFKKT